MRNRAAGSESNRGEVFLFLHTDNFQRIFKPAGPRIRIVREPVAEPYGTVAVFAICMGISGT